MPRSPESPVVPARERIVDQMRWQPRTVDELAAEVGLTPNGVRSHLAVLQRDGVVRALGVRPSGEAGKPPTLYGLSAEAEEELSRAYPATLVALVESVRATQGDHRLVEVLSEAGRRLGRDSGEADPIRVLESLGARVRVTPLGNESMLLEGAGCPLSAAVREQPLSCELVRSMLSAATGSEVTMCCQHGDSPKCRFEMRTS
ncbi:MAG TPA: ArsR family transcriptional regulator [Gemmatimonadales bacterium]|nr:ArsR family transcriptional regulator [Gemmatimonadales bacterium]